VKLCDVMRDVPGIRTVGTKEVDVTGICYDSRRVRPGDLFAAVAGEKFDGASFIGDAMKKGAAAFLAGRNVPPVQGTTFVLADDVRSAMALASRNLYHDPSADLKLIGITGTNGKTTTAYIIHGILNSANLRPGLIGTVQYLIGSEVLSAPRTTPESPDLNAYLASMVSSGCKTCILEVSSHAMVLHRVDGMRMEVAVFTNLTHDHLDFHSDMDDYFQAKARLFTDSNVANRVVNIDDRYGTRLWKEVGGPILTVGMKEGDIRVRGEINGGEMGSRFVLETPWGEIPVNTTLPGHFNVYNIMTAVAVCGLLGMDVGKISGGIQNVTKIPGRFERVDKGQPYTAIVDYAHTPDALKNLLENVRMITRGRTIVVFGCGGDRDRSKRPIMGAIAGKLSDQAIVTSDNPRSEDPDSIIDDIVAGMTNCGAKARRVVDRREAIDLASRMARPGDALVVAGKGHENYQIIGDRILPFSDVDEVGAAIARFMEVAR